MINRRKNNFISIIEMSSLGLILAACNGKPLSTPRPSHSPLDHTIAPGSPIATASSSPALLATRTWTSTPSLDPMVLPTNYPMNVEKRLDISEFDRNNAILFEWSSGVLQWMDISIINSNGSKYECITCDASTYYENNTSYYVRFQSPSWAHDGTMYAYASNSMIWDGLRIRRNNLPEIIILSKENAWYVNLAWSPDDKYIAYSTNTGLSTSSVCYVGVDLLHPEVAESHCISPENANIYPSWSHDGKSIIFSGGDVLDANKGKPTDLYVWNIVTGNVSKITNSPESEISPRWSMDGMKLAFIARDNDTREYTLYIANADGSGRVPVTGTNNVRDFNWSPDGEQIVYTELSTIKNDRCDSIGCLPFTVLKIIDLGTGKVTNLTDGKTWIGAPSWRQ